MLFLVIGVCVVAAAVTVGVICRFISKKKDKKRNEIRMMKQKALDEALSNTAIQENVAEGYVIRLAYQGIDKDAFFSDNNAVITIGRAKDNKMVLDDESVSKHHCSLYNSSGGMIIEDLNSQNNTLIKRHGKIIRLCSEKLPLNQNDIIIIGRVVLEYKSLRYSG